MAVTRPGTGIGASGGGGMVASYWDSTFAESLYPSLFLYGFGAKRRVPPNFGLTIKITRLKRQTGIVGLQSTNSYGVPLTSFNALCSQFVSGTLAKYRGVYGNSDIALLTTLGDPTEFAIRDLARDLALQMDNGVRGVISAASSGRFLGGSGVAYGSLVNTTRIKLNDVFKAVAYLRACNNPRWPDGNYPLILHPSISFDLKATISSGAAVAWVDINKYATNDTTAKIFRGEVGKIAGARFVESSNVKRLVGAGGVSAGFSGWQNLMLAPEAYYVVEMDQMKGRIIVKGLGSGGTFDADNSLATVAAKVFFAPIRGFQAADPNAAGFPEIRMIRLVGASSIT